jgi:hypothetical protein
MALHVFLFVLLLVVCIQLNLAMLWCLDWFPRRLEYRRRSRPWSEVKSRPVVLPLTMVDNSAFSPTRLAFPHDVPSFLLRAAPLPFSRLAKFAPLLFIGLNFCSRMLFR